ncbi:MAG: DUF3846 domain-containing protein [Clostridia bacterium]
MKENKMKIVKIEPNQKPIVKEIDNNLNSLQAEVGGLIQCVYLDDGNIAVINEEGKINGSEPNRRIGRDIICGPFFICGDDGEDFTSLSDQDLEKYKKEFEQIPKFSGDEPELEPRIEVVGFNW